MRVARLLERPSYNTVTSTCFSAQSVESQKCHHTICHILYTNLCLLCKIMWHNGLMWLYILTFRWTDIILEKACDECVSISGISPLFTQEIHTACSGRVTLTFKINHNNIHRLAWLLWFQKSTSLRSKRTTPKKHFENKFIVFDTITLKRHQFDSHMSTCISLLF